MEIIIILGIAILYALFSRGGERKEIEKRLSHVNGILEQMENLFF